MPDLSEDEIANTDFGSYSKEQYLDDLGRITQYHCDLDLAETVVLKITSTVGWYIAAGAVCPVIRPLLVQARRTI